MDQSTSARPWGEMNFEVLGPLRVRVADTAAHIDGPKQRALLAVLISRAGHVVPAGALIEAVWGAHPPASPRKALTWHIGQVRDLLDSPDRLTWQGNGYVLAAGAGEIDAARFEDLRNRGLEAGRNGDPKAAGELLGEALALWRGDAYADVGENAAGDGEAARLNGLRQDALAHRIAADLELGRHDALVPELTALAARHPLDEGFRAQLMLALYRCGRRADALEVYRETRRLLVSELGLEPGPELRAMEQTVLAGKAASETPQRVPATSGPAELPSAPRVLTGRDEDVGHLLAALDGPGGVCAIAGPGGIGKSALALHVAHLLAGRFPDGQLYVNLHGTTPDVKTLAPEEALGRFLRSLNGEAPPTALDVEELAGRFRSATAGRRLLIVIDDARDAAQVRPLLPGGGTCAVIITGRRILSTLDEAGLHRLGVLGETDAVAVLARLVGESRVDAEPAAAREIARYCDGLPLALCVAAARLRARPRAPLSGLASRLAAEDARLGELSVDDRAVRASLAVSHRDLADEVDGGPAARLFRLLGLLDTPDLTVPVAAALADVPMPAADALLDRLIDAQLIEDHQPERYRLHDLIRLYSKELAAEAVTAAGGARAFGRVLEYYVGTARDALGVFEPSASYRLGWEKSAAERGGAHRFADRAAALTWIRGELDNLRAVVRQAVRLPGEEAIGAVTLSVLLKLPLQYSKSWREMLDVGRNAVAIADLAGGPEHRLFARRDTAEVLLSLGQVDEALLHLGHARSAVRLMPDRSGEASVWGITGAAYRRAGRFTEALEAFGRSIELAREHGLVQAEAATHVEAGFLHFKIGDLDAALAAQERAAVLIAGLNSPHGEAITSAAIGAIFLATARYGEAAERFTHAIAKNREAGQHDAVVAADYRWGLAEACFALGDRDSARAHWGDSIALLHRLGAIGDKERAELEAAEHPSPPAMISVRPKPR
ncbi:BTAD domain-containing putative transcriptional regulator [Phytomonospora sp. NPDC050363]|uniref:AfsR/SARP family transcriptional regulator n=1 Tax=Phytomonospora sp. NPDC050363 TaxID=3155642 RepID=UPI0033EA392C